MVKRLTRGITHFKEALGERLQRRVQPFILRRLKKDVLKDLPERTEVNLRIPQTEEEAGLYDGLRLRATQRIGKAQDPRDKFFILEEITRLRQAACSPALIDKQFSVTSTKLQRMLELVNELKEAEIAVSFFPVTSFLDLAQEKLVQEGIDFLRLDGSTPAKKRQQLVRQFQKGRPQPF